MPTPVPPPDDLAAQCRQCASDMASRNLLVSEAARGRAPGLLVGAAEEMERLRAAIDAFVEQKVERSYRDLWQVIGDPHVEYDTRAEAEAAYRNVAFPGLDVDTEKGA